MNISMRNLIGISLFFFTVSTLTGCSSSETSHPVSSSKEEKEWGNAPDFTLPRLQNATDQFEQGGLTGAVGTE